MIVKSPLKTATTGSTDARKRFFSGVFGLDLMFYMSRGKIVAKSKRTAQEKQRKILTAQQELWAECDCMWRNMSVGQRYLWSKYYHDQKKKSRTRLYEYAPEKRKRETFGKKEIGQLSFFMHKGLKYDLVDYLRDFLKADWEVEPVEVTSTHYLITARIKTQRRNEELTAVPERILLRGS